MLRQLPRVTTASSRAICFSRRSVMSTALRRNHVFREPARPPSRPHPTQPTHLGRTQPTLGQATRSYSSSPHTPVADPDRPELFYHLFDPPTPVSHAVPVYALSFIGEVLPSANSCAVIGWLPAIAVSESEEAGLNDFVPNEKFLDVLHEAIQGALRDGVDEVQRNGAIQTQQGWMHIHDDRNVPALGRIGDPDDIIASVRVEDGQILPDTYQPMPSYRLCTSDGILKLTDGLAQRLHEVLSERAKAEAGSR